MPPRIAMIGAGSIGFTRTLAHDILAVSELRGCELSLTDINAANLDAVYRLLERDIAANGFPTKLSKTTDRRAALDGAKYAFCTVRVGGLEAFETDIRIPLKYGVDQCVGDTLCAGGIMYGQRGIPVLLDVCRDIRDVAPGCVFMNYSNPMAMLTWACNTYGGVNTIGLCHGVQDSTEVLANALGVPLSELDVAAAGINHQTWFLTVAHKGRDLRAEVLGALERHPVYRETEKVRIDILRRFGYWSTESNGHCSEYVPWYRKRRDRIARWIDRREWIHGETGGYLRFCKKTRATFARDCSRWLKEPAPDLSSQARSREHGSYIIEAMETGRTYRGHFNVINRGCITNLPPDCVIEAPGYIDRAGLHTPIVGDLPLACAATCNASVQVQRMAVEAAVRGDVVLLKQAMLHDPLVGAVCSPPEVWKMADEMIAAQKKWLPQYRVRAARGTERRRKASGHR
ncbi:MAG: alpha-glucosidase/alpha-galactosidase [Candidatus Hydrogenedentes bacterium]|nr:alpha-glucosidase/alpha-galactosidase [Candidatus Hydrogenedentota bacterium]